MFGINGLAYAKVSSVPLGHLILCHAYGGAVPEFALRVEVPQENAATDNDGVLFLRSPTPWGDIGAVVAVGMGEHLCLDLGLPVFSINDDFVATAISNRQYDARPGMLALCGPDLFILAAFGRYRNHHAWWHVPSGKIRKCEERLVFERWCVGLTDLNRKFIPQLRYPEDFKRDPPMS